MLIFWIFLNIIPEWISNKKSNNNEYLSIKDIIIFFVLSFFILITEFLEIIPLIIIKDKKEKGYGDQFIFVEFLILFLIPHFSEIYYRHQNFSFFIFTLIEITKIIFFIFDKQFKDILTVLFGIINSIIYAFYFINIKRLMKYKFISPYKCNFMLGIINFPLIIIIYFIISLTSFGNKNNDYYIDNFKELFEDDLGVINIIRLITLPIAYGIFAFLFNKVIYDFTLYHSFILLLIENLFVEIFSQIEKGNIFEIIFIG